ncbi:MAG: tetratricopeptide (TPR) repeat protein [Planctomycetota bacterium]|jgi:tetratricopeptide (TPR) repeat protein
MDPRLSSSKVHLFLGSLVLGSLLIASCGDSDPVAGPESPPDSPSGESTGTEAPEGEAESTVAGTAPGDQSGREQDDLSLTSLDPMESDVSEIDEAVARKIQRARSQVLKTPENPNAWRALGHTYQANLIPTLAIAAYGEAIQLDPDFATTYYHQALAQHSAGETTAALQSADAAIERDDQVPAFHWRRGNWLFDMGRIDDAKAGYERALVLKPMNAAAIVGLARVQLDADELDKAIAALSQILSESATMPFSDYVRRLLATAYTRNGEPDRAGALEAMGTDAQPFWYDPARFETANFEVKTIYHRAAKAVEFANSGEYDLAVDEMRVVVDSSPEETATRNQLAFFLAMANRPEESMAEYRTVLDQSPSNREALIQLGRALGKIGREEEGLALLDKAIADEDLYPPAYFYRGSVLRRMGRIEEAAAAYRRAVELDETRKTPWIAVGILEAQLKQWTTALQAFERAEALGLDRGDMWLGKAECLMELGRFRESQKALQSSSNKPFFNATRWAVIDTALKANARRAATEAADESTPDEDGADDGQ